MAGQQAEERPPTEADQAAAPARRPSARAVGCALVVLGVACGLRLWGLEQDLPNLTVPDEHRVVHRALAFGSGDLNPHDFTYGTVSQYLTFFCYGVYYAAGRAAGLFSGAEDFAVAFFVDPSPFFWIARLLQVAGSALACYLVFAAAHRLTGNPLAACFAGCLLAVSPVFIHYTQRATPDGLLVLACATVLWLMVRFDGPRIPLMASVLIGLTIGVGTSTKVFAAGLVLPYALWILMAPQDRFATKLLHGLVVALAFLAGIFVSSPYTFLDWASASQIWQRTGEVYPSATASEWWQAAAHWLRSPWRLQSLGPVGATLCLVGLAAIARERKALVVGTVAGGVLYSIGLGRFHTWQPNHLLPIYPFVAWGAGLGWQALSRYLAQRTTPAPAYAAVAAVALLGLGPPTVGTVRYDRELSRTLTGTAARQWIESHVPDGARLLLIGPTWALPQVLEDEVALRRLLGASEGETSDAFTHVGKYYEYKLAALPRQPGPKYDVYRVKNPMWARSSQDLDRLKRLAQEDVAPGQAAEAESWGAYQRAGIEYVVISGESRLRTDNEAFPAAQQFYASLPQYTDHLITLGGPELGLRGEPVEIYRVRAPGDQPPAETRVGE